LLPIQKIFFNKTIDLNHFNQAQWFVSNEPIAVDKLQKILTKIYEHHDEFRLRYRKDKGQYQQYYSDDDTIDFKVIKTDKLKKTNISHIANKLQRSLNIEKGPISKLAYIEGIGLLWVIHHLVIDGVSWRILLEDLNILYNNQKLPLKTHSYKIWGEYLETYKDLEETKKYYANIPKKQVLPLDTIEIAEIQIKNTTTTFSKEITHNYNTETRVRNKA